MHRGVPEKPPLAWLWLSCHLWQGLTSLPVALLGLGGGCCAMGDAAESRGSHAVLVVLGAALGHGLAPWRVRAMAEVGAEAIGHPGPLWLQELG